MKSKFKFIVALFVISILSSGITVVAEELTKEYNESWSASGIETLEISNKFGLVKVNNQNSGEITIDVLITVEAPNEKKANELLDKIEVDFGKSGSTVKAATKIESNFKSKQKFSIDYTINVPSDKNLVISNKYGNTVIEDLNASGKFNIQYGNLTAGDLNAPESGDMEVYLAYGKSSVQSASSIKVEVKYSSMNFGEVGDLNMVSKYSNISIEELKSIDTDSKYDTFNFEEVGSVKATSKYSHFKIEELKKSLTITAGYGGVRVEEISPEFESISIENSYGQIKLGLNDANYSIDANCRYCGIKFDEDDFSGDRIKENNSRSIKGNIGQGGSGKVHIRSSYGEIKLLN